MRQIEFETIIHQGTIALPKEHVTKVHGRVRVIIITADEEDTTDMVEYLMEHPLTGGNGIPLSRDDVYDRAQ